MSGNEYDTGYAERQIGRSRNPLRKLVKHFYLNHILRDVQGRAVDFGCGAGQLLQKLAPGSIGLEVNPSLVSALQSGGLNVKRYDPAYDELSFLELSPGFYGTFIMAHVLEHFENAADSLKKILKACGRLDIDRVIVVLPGKKGYMYDTTHRTFVNRDYLVSNDLLECEGYTIADMHYFPINLEWVGSYFTFHDFKVVYTRS